MELSIREQKGLNAVLTVQVHPADYEEAVKKSLNQYRAKMNIKGFRPGQVPAGVVKKMVGNDIKREEIEKLLQKNINDYIKSNDIKLILSPISAYIAEDIEWKNESFEFLYDIGYRPQVKIDVKELNKLSRYSTKPTPEALDKEIEILQRQAGKMEKVETVTDHNELSIVMQFAELDEEGNKMEGGQRKLKVWVMAEMPPKLKEFLIGKAAESKHSTDIFTLLSDDDVLSLFEIDKNTLNDLNHNFEIEITAVYKIKSAELNEELFKRYFPDKEIANTDAFKAEWMTVYQSYYERQADELFYHEAKNYLMENTETEMPMEFLKKYFLLSWNAKTEEEVKDYEKQFVLFQQELKWMLISDSIADAQKIEITEENVIAYTQSLIASEFSRSGLPLPEEKKMQEYVYNYLSKESNYSRAFVTLKEDGVYKYLKSASEPKVKDVEAKVLEELSAAHRKTMQEQHTHEHTH